MITPHTLEFPAEDSRRALYFFGGLMNSSRRSFLKFGAVALASLPFLSQILGSRVASAADADLPLAKETEDPAKSLHYTADADKPGKNSAARKDKAKAGQYCYACQLFNRVDGDKKKGTGKCMIMPKNRVQAAGWCQSWVQNPNVKA
jgi:High potential iron-sulfur protein